MPKKVVFGEDDRKFHPPLSGGMLLTDQREAGTYRMKKRVRINELVFDEGQEYVIEPEYIPTMRSLDAIEAV